MDTQRRRQEQKKELLFAYDLSMIEEYWTMTIG